MKRAPGGIIFVTGAGTGVGKTVLTAMLLAAARASGREVLALKPFCSGSRADARALRAWEKKCLTLEEINPFYFDKPLAPLAAGPVWRLPSLPDVVKYIRAMARRCDTLLIEGSGGLLVPLGPKYAVADLICALRCPVIVVSRNELGVINHTLLTVKHLQSIGVKCISVVMMPVKKPDLSARSNLRVLRGQAPQIPMVALPFLGHKPLMMRRMKKSVTLLKKTLAQILDHAIVSLPARKGGGLRK